MPGNGDGGLDILAAQRGFGPRPPARADFRAFDDCSSECITAEVTSRDATGRRETTETPRLSLFPIVRHGCFAGMRHNAGKCLFRALYCGNGQVRVGTMTQAHTRPEAAKSRPGSRAVEAETIPPRADRRTLARLVSARFFPVSPGMLRTWPIGWRLMGSRAIGETAAAFAEAERRLAAAPIIPPKEA